LVCDYFIVHCCTNNAQYLVVEEEFWSKARRRKRHRQEVTMRATVRRFAVGVKIVKKNRPECLAASINYALREMVSEDAVAIFLDFK
jgi:hypothetical protein